MSEFDNDGDWGDGDNGGDWGEDIEDWGEDSVGETNPQANPLIPDEADARMHSPPASVPVQESKPALVAKFDSQGRPFVCCKVKVVNGKPVQITEWRRPTADEYNAIMFKGKKLVVEGGVAAENVPAPTNAAATSAMVPLGEAPQPMWKKVAKVGAGVAIVGTVGYFGYRLISRNLSE